MSEGKKNSRKRSYEKSIAFTFPDGLEIPESALNDSKFKKAHVRIYNDPRIYIISQLNNTERGSSRFDVDYNEPVNVVFNEPVVKRKSILSNFEDQEENALNDTGTRKSVSFFSKITFIDAIDCDNICTEIGDIDYSEDKPKKKSNVLNETRVGSVVMKKPTPATQPPVNKKKKNKPSSKNGLKTKSPTKELFKFKIMKPFRKSKAKKLKHLQKKYGRRMFKSFVRIQRKNLKNIPDKVDEIKSEECVTSIQDSVIDETTKKVEVEESVMPMQVDADDTGEVKEKEEMNEEIIQSNLIESSTSYDIVCQNSSSSTESVESDNDIDSNETKEIQNSQILSSTVSVEADSTSCQNIDSNSDSRLDSSEDASSDFSDKINGDLVPALNDSPNKTFVSSNDNPSPELVTSTPLPNIIDKVTCNVAMQHHATNKDETGTANGEILEPNDDHHQEHHNDSADNMSSMNVSLLKPTNSLAKNNLVCDTSAE